MPEGSVIVDGRDVDDSEETEVTQESTEETQEAPSEEKTEAETQPEASEGEQQLTEKGTKLDPNPMSAVHQQLANERRQRLEYEKVLNDPERYIELAKQAGVWKEQKEPEKPVEAKKYTADDVQSAEDVANLYNTANAEIAQLRSLYEQKVAELEQRVTGLSAERQAESIANSIQRDSVLVKGQYPELKPDAPHAKELEKAISNRYHELNWDENTGMYTNRYPLTKVAEMIIEPIRLTRQQAVEDAQTVVQHKNMGKVVTSSKKQSDSATEDTSIAGLISKQFRK